MNLFWCRKGFRIHPGTAFLTKALKVPFLNYTGKTARLHQATNSHNSFNQRNQAIMISTICGFYLLLLNLILLDWKESEPPQSPSSAPRPLPFSLGLCRALHSVLAGQGWWNGCLCFSKATVPGTNDM